MHRKRELRSCLIRDEWTQCQVRNRINDEIRESKYRLSKKFDNDVSKIAEYLKAHEALSAANLIKSSRLHVIRTC
jgi:pterin-4a-carbinolamine dehydratase